MTTPPSDAPPSYEQITGSSSGAGAGPSRRPAETSTSTSNATSYKERNGIPGLTRRSMEDEGRPLPYGWIRQYDPDNHHQFFVNTNVEPPKSIWYHPYDDEEYMNSLDPVERKKIQGMQRVPSEADIEAESSDDDERHHHSHSMKAAAGTAVLPPRSTGAEQSGGVTKFGRRMKDKMTGTTHEQRERKRIQRAEEERRTYQRHIELRQAMSRAAQTGQPQFIGRDHNGRDVYIEPPQGAGPPQGAYGYNPYQQGPYANPNATFIRPQYPYSRPYGGGYGGGFGLPLAGGLMGGALLGGLLF